MILENTKAQCMSCDWAAESFFLTTLDATTAYHQRNNPTHAIVYEPPRS